MTRPAFLLINRNKSKWVARAVRGALSQTVPCYILISDQHSDDDSMAIIRQEVTNYQAQRDEYVGYPSFHTIKVVKCPVGGEFSMKSCNAHIAWCLEQLPEDISMIYQCSSDDYSLPARVQVCETALTRIDRQPVGICNAMYFEAPSETNRTARTGFPERSGFVNPGEGLQRLVYGSTIWAYRRDWLLKVGLDVNCTLDVYLGFLAALDGLYYVADAQHVHVQHAEKENQMGFQGRLLAASGDEQLILGEANCFQLSQLYLNCWERAQQLHGSIDAETQGAIANMILGTSCAWIRARTVLHEKKLMPMILPA